MMCAILITIIISLAVVICILNYPSKQRSPFIPARPTYIPPRPQKLKPTKVFQLMTLNEYQEAAMQTCMPSCNNFSYMFLNLVGEVGELASKVAKSIRRGEASIYCDNLIECAPCEIGIDEDGMRKEAGDVLWQLSGLCKVMGWSLEDVAQENLKKLADRQARNVIDGNGDNR